VFLLLTGTRPDLNALRARKGGESPIIEMRPAAPLALAEIAENALELNGARAFSTAAQFRNALTTILWGNRGSQSASALTITGMPARVEIAPPRSIRVATVGMQSAMRGRGSKPQGWRNQAALIGAACAIALIAAFGAALRGPGVAATAPSTPGDAAQTSVAPSPDVTADAPILPDSTAPTAVSPAATPRANMTRTSKPPAAVVEKGLVVFAVAPWGEVYVNGARKGTTPPLAQLTLPAGRHTIELRNGKRQPYIAQVDVAPERPLRISHLFQ